MVAVGSTTFITESIICWDFDHTLFGYQRAASDCSNLPQHGEFAGFGPRYGIAPVLERLARLHYLSDITTSGSIELAQKLVTAPDRF